MSLKTDDLRVRVIVTSDTKAYGLRESIIREKVRDRSLRHSPANEPSVQRLNRRMEKV